MKARFLFRLLPMIVSFTTALCITPSTVTAADETLAGMAGVGTWAVEAEFKDIKVVSDDKVLFGGGAAPSLSDFKIINGEWAVEDGTLRQTGEDKGARALFGEPTWNDYVLTLKARKLAGSEGFLILFGIPASDLKAKFWCNLGGWDNKSHGIQYPGILETRVPGTIETGRWYDIRLVVRDVTVSVHLDDQLVQTVTIPLEKNAQREFPHALIPDLLADPSIIEEDGVFYCFATTDGMGRHLDTSGLPVVWKSKDFLNWSFDGSIMPPSFDAKYWAPSAPVKKDGRYYLFATLNGLVTGLVADKLEGPYLTLDGKEVHEGSGWSRFPTSLKHPIDAEVLRDDDGAYYMVVSRRNFAMLKDDFSGFDGNPTEVKTKRAGYSEGPALFKRGDLYYYLYTLGGNEVYQYAYMMSRSVNGPWEEPEHDIIATTDHEQGIYGPGHGCFFNLPGTSRWFFVCLEYGRSSTNRQILASEMFFNPDGTIQPIKLSFKGVGALRPDPEYARPNLAQDAVARASSSQADFRVPARSDASFNRIENFAPANAIDGSNGSRWMATGDDQNAWYQLDLGQAREIGRTELYFVKPTMGHAYQLEASLDGKTWKPCGGHPDIQVKSPHKDTQIGTARYLRVTILKGTPGLWDFRVY